MAMKELNNSHKRVKNLPLMAMKELNNSNKRVKNLPLMAMKELKLLSLRHSAAVSRKNSISFALFRFLSDTQISVATR